MTTDPAADPAVEPTAEPTAERERAPRIPLMVVAWAWVGLPFAYGVYELVRKVTQLFTG